MYKASNYAIEVQILKRQFIKKYNPPHAHVLQLQNTVQKIKHLLSIDNKVGALNRDERKSFEGLAEKYTFYHSVIAFVINSR